MSWIDKLKARWPMGGSRRYSDAGSTSTAVAETWAWESRPAKKPTQSQLPHFHATAGDQLDRTLSDRFAAARIRLRQAFTPSQPVTNDRMFAGRTEVLTRLISSIEGQRLHTVIYGERGIGKTSMLHVLSRAARDARYLVVYTSCGADSGFDEIFRALAADIPLLYHGAYGPTAPEAEKGSSFASLLPPGPVSVRAAGDLLGNVVGTRVLIMLDEFDRCESAEFQRNIAELMKSLSDRAARVQFVIAGVAQNLTDLVAYIPSIRRNVFALAVPPMTASEVRDLVKNGEDASGLVFDEGAIEFLVSLAHGSPYLATLLSHHAGLVAIDEQRTQVTTDDVSAAIAEALAEFSGRMSKRSQAQLAEAVRKGLHKALAPLAREAQLTGGRFGPDEIAELYRTPENISRSQSLIEKLAAEEMLIEASEDEFGRQYRFQDESMPAYLWMLASQEHYLDGPSTMAPIETAQDAAARR